MENEEKIARRIKSIKAEEWRHYGDVYQAPAAGSIRVEVEKQGEKYGATVYHIEISDYERGESGQEYFAGIKGERAKELFNHIAEKVGEHEKEREKKRLEGEKEERRKREEWKMRELERS